MPGSKTFLVSLTLGVVLLVLALLVLPKRAPPEMLLVQPSPDGRAIAYVLGIPNNSPDTRGVRLCLTVATAFRPQTTGCSLEVAHLYQVPRKGEGSALQIRWVSPTNVEIHYRVAASTRLYRPTASWTALSRSLSSGITLPPVTVRIVHDS